MARGEGGDRGAIVFEPSDRGEVSIWQRFGGLKAGGVKMLRTALSPLSFYSGVKIAVRTDSQICRYLLGQISGCERETGVNLDLDPLVHHGAGVLQPAAVEVGDGCPGQMPHPV